MSVGAGSIKRAAKTVKEANIPETGKAVKETDAPGAAGAEATEKQSTKVDAGRSRESNAANKGKKEAETAAKKKKAATETAGKKTKDKAAMAGKKEGIGKTAEEKGKKTAEPEGIYVTYGVGQQLPTYLL